LSYNAHHGPRGHHCAHQNSRRGRQVAWRDGALHLWLAGAWRNRPDSDLDVFVDFDPGRFSFVELVELEEMLSRELGLKVALGTHDALHPLMKSAIEREAIRVL
jgi:uncharacterized protein